MSDVVRLPLTSFYFSFFVFFSCPHLLCEKKKCLFLITLLKMLHKFKYLYQERFLLSENTDPSDDSAKL